MQFAYFALDLFFAFIWIVLFVATPRVRPALLLMSPIAGALGFVQPIIARDYFTPSYLLPVFDHLGVEDLLYAFFTGGVAAVIYDAFIPLTRGTKSAPRAKIFWSVYFAGIGAFLAGTLWLGYPGILIGAALLTVGGSILVLVRGDLVLNAMGSGVCCALLVFASYELYLIPLYPEVTRAFWTTSFWVMNMPYQELVWAFAWGFFFGPSYKFIRGLPSAAVFLR